MSRRRRSLLFACLALIAAAGAAAIADGYGSRLARGYGPLRPVVVIDEPLAAGVRLGPREAETALSLRRIPERFVPAGALSSPAHALGLIPRTALPAGSYLLAAQLGSKPSRDAGTLRLGGDRRPVEVSVSGAGALLATGAGQGGGKVDVVITAEPDETGPGRTYIAAASVPLLALRPGPEGPGGVAAATVAVSRRQALRLIAAESFARRVTVLPAG